MMKFSKYHGTGNDFVIVDQMNEQQLLSPDQVSFICSRRYGVGADGIMLLQPSAKVDFKMVYYNSDGRESSMCGNGGRCIVHLAHSLGYIKSTTTFEAIDGLHDAVIDSEHPEIVSLLMKNVNAIEQDGDDLLLDTGSPHYIHFVPNADDVELLTEGRAIRYNDRFSNSGINVNFVEVLSDGIYVRTYERGVEDETLSCGTGVAAAVIAASASGRINNESCDVVTRGGRLQVSFIRENGNFKSVWLKGPAVFVFKGEINL